MLYNEEAVRGNIRNREGKRVFYLGKGDQLTSAARDYLTRQRIDILPAEQARQERYRLLTGGYVEEKGENLTHLNGDVLVRKDHPRIRFRGKLDTLQSELLLCQLADKSLEKPVEELLKLTRDMVRCEVLNEALKWDGVWGFTWEELRKRSQFPQDYYGQPHFMPSAADGLVMAWLNRARCAAREAELAAVEAAGSNAPIGEDIVRGLNRVSSGIYLLMIQRKAERS